MNKLFELGKLYITFGINREMAKDKKFSDFVCSSLVRYIKGDWGDTCDEDSHMNDEAVKNGERILAVYTMPSTDKTIWIITEWDRSATTILFPSEY